MNKTILFAYYRSMTWEKRRKLLTVYFSLDEAWMADPKGLEQAGWRPKQIADFLAWRNTVDEPHIEKTLEQHGIWTIPVDDPLYPTLLRHVYDPPLCLFGRGTMPSHGPTVAIVGSRKCDDYGRAVAHQMSRELARAGVTVVSGLAFGIDSIAHQATLDVDGRTIAVLAGGIDDATIHPSSHRRLAQTIISSGNTLVTEYSPYTTPTPFTFPLRNRIIAGLSSATLVIEAGKKSGALITASYALDNNREVLAIPHPITSLLGEGTNQLIKNGAHCVTSPDDVLALLTLSSSKHVDLPHAQPDIPSLSPHESSIFQLITNQPIHIDDLIRATKCSSQEISTALSLLEIRGYIKHLGNMTYTRPL